MVKGSPTVSCTVEKVQVGGMGVLVGVNVGVRVAVAVAVGVGMAVGVAVSVAVLVAVAVGRGVGVAVAVGGSVAVGVGARTVNVSGVAVAITTPVLSTSCTLRAYCPARLTERGKTHRPLAATLPSLTTWSPSKRRTVAPGSPWPVSWLSWRAARPLRRISRSAWGGTAVLVGVDSGLTMI